MMDTTRRALGVAGAALAALAVAGCAHERVVIQPVDVKVPVVIPCAAQLPADPERHTRAAPPAADIFEAMKRSLAEIEAWEGWALQAKAAVRGCQPNGGTKP